MPTLTPTMKHLLRIGVALGTLLADVAAAAADPRIRVR